MEVQRRDGMKDRLQWYCEKCNSMLHEDVFDLKDIVNELPAAMDRYYASLEKRTCKKCGAVMEPPVKL